MVTGRPLRDAKELAGYESLGFKPAADGVNLGAFRERELNARSPTGTMQAVHREGRVCQGLALLLRCFPGGTRAGPAEHREGAAGEVRGKQSMVSWKQRENSVQREVSTELCLTQTSGGGRPENHHQGL